MTYSGRTAQWLRAHAASAANGKIAGSAGFYPACSPDKHRPWLTGLPPSINSLRCRISGNCASPCARCAPNLGSGVACCWPTRASTAPSQEVTRALLPSWKGCSTEQSQRVQALAFEEALVESCVRLMATHGSAPGVLVVPSADVRRVHQRLADESSRVPSLGELARMTGLSRYQVLRRFTKVYGLPPHAWLLRQRAERVRLLIRDGRTLTAAALACGFADQSHMSRVFVRQFGFTPGAWRNAVRPLRTFVQD